MGTQDGRAPRRATMRDVAHTAGVPVSAVPLALDNRPGVSAERRAAVLKAAELIGYERSGRGRKPLYGLLMEELSPDARSDGFIDTLIRGIYSAARLVGAQIVLGLYHPETDPLNELAGLASRPLDGLLLVNGGDITFDVIDALTQARLPTLLIENRVDRPISSVSSDNFRAGFESTRHLLALGHRRIAIIQGSERYASLHERYRGYLVAMTEAGVTPDQELVVAQAPHAGRKGYEQCKALLSLKSPPSAIYAVSDKSAFGAAAAIHERGLVVGSDMSLVGTDNVEESALHVPPLTTFDTGTRDLGRVALQQLSAVTGDPGIVTHSVVEGRLVVRGSTTTNTT